MKRIEAIIRPTEVGKVCLTLEAAGYPRPRVSQIESESRRDAVYLLRGKSYDVDMTMKARVEVLVGDGETEKIVSAIRDATFRGKFGDGMVLVQAVEEVSNTK